MVVITKTEALKEVLANDFAYANVMFIAEGVKYKGEIIKAKSKIFSDPPGLEEVLDHITSKIILAWELKPLDEWELLDYAERIFEIAGGQTKTTVPPAKHPAPSMIAPVNPSELVTPTEQNAEQKNAEEVSAGEQGEQSSNEPRLVVMIADAPVNRKELEEKIRKAFSRRGVSAKDATIRVERKGGQYVIHVSGTFVAKKKIPSRVIARTLEALFFNLLSASVTVEREDINLEIGDPGEYLVEVL